MTDDNDDRRQHTIRTDEGEVTVEVWNAGRGRYRFDAETTDQLEAQLAFAYWFRSAHDGADFRATWLQSRNDEWTANVRINES